MRLGSAEARRCDSEKAGYRSRQEALDSAEVLMHQGRVKPRCHLMPYLCDRCHEWHIANKRIV